MIRIEFKRKTIAATLSMAAIESIDFVVDLESVDPHIVEAPRECLRERLLESSGKIDITLSTLTITMISVDNFEQKNGRYKPAYGK